MLSYVDEGASGSLKYEYVIEDDNLTATNWLRTMKFEILDEYSLKLDEDIFCFEGNE